MPPANLLGQRFGRLAVVSAASGMSGQRWWKCRCDCGALRVYSTGQLNFGRMRSCGCLAREKSLARFTTHGHAASGRSSTYIVWAGMLARCRNRRNPKYSYYGGRGILVCDRWLEFENFLADMGERPSTRHSIDRFPDNNGNYEPGNCRWATRAEQMRNTRVTTTVTFGGETLSLSDWCTRLAVNYHTVKTRINVLGWPPAQALGLEPVTSAKRGVYRTRRA